jgi:ABC-type sugar transport system permease subunit
VAPVGQKSVTVIFGTESRNTVVTGTDNEYFITQDWDLKQGRTFFIGALEEQVLLQFLVEAVVLSLFGGFIGILVGLALAALATSALKVPFLVDPAIILLAFSFSAVVGIVFGYFPARRAARLDPIEALRHE